MDNETRCYDLDYDEPRSGSHDPMSDLDSTSSKSDPPFTESSNCTEELSDCKRWENWLAKLQSATQEIERLKADDLAKEGLNKDASSAIDEAKRTIATLIAKQKTSEKQEQHPILKKKVVIEFFEQRVQSLPTPPKEHIRSASSAESNGHARLELHFESPRLEITTLLRETGRLSSSTELELQRASESNSTEKRNRDFRMAIKAVEEACLSSHREGGTEHFTELFTQMKNELDLEYSKPEMKGKGNSSQNTN